MSRRQRSHGKEVTLRVFVAGATGVLGRRVVALLVSAGDDVTGVARDGNSEARLRAVGALPVRVSLFDRDALTAAVVGHDVVCNLATSIPTGERAASPAAWETNHRIRSEGSRNLVDAALATTTGRYLQESIALLYADGGEQLLEESATVEPTSITASALDAESEAARFADLRPAGTALRFASFYGADSAQTIEAVDAARAGVATEIGAETAYRSSITTDDAAAAVVAALRAPSGVYNVADDRPLRRGEFATALAQAVGKPVPTPPTVDIDLPPEFSMLLRSQRVSNQRFKTVTGWRPRFASAWDAWPSIVAELDRSSTLR